MIRKIVWSVVVVALLGWIVYDHLMIRPVGSDSVAATPSPVIKRAPVVPVVIKAPVRTYQGSTKANLKLPAAVVADPQQQVISASQIRADLRPQTVSTVINTETGAVETFVKTDPYLWLSWEPRGEARVAYGYKFDPRQHDMRPVARLHIGYDVVRVKALTMGVTATLDSDRAAFVGVGVAYRW